MEINIRFTYSEQEAIAEINQWLKDKPPSERRELIKSALSAHFYAAAVRTPGAIELSRSILERKLLDLDVLERQILEANNSELNIQPKSTPSFGEEQIVSRLMTTEDEF
jgi:hypothetical protein